MKTNTSFLVSMILILAFFACKKNDEKEVTPQENKVVDFRDAVIGNYLCSCYHEKKTVEGVYVNDSTEESKTTVELKSFVIASEVKKTDEPLAGNIKISNPGITVFLDSVYLTGSARIPSNRGPFAHASFIGDSMYCDYSFHSGYHPKGYGTFESYKYKCKKNI